MKHLFNLGRDLVVFAEILVYWPFAILVMLPAKWLDRRLGTRVFPWLNRLTGAIAER